jgi:hypothetical protein
VRIEYTNGHSKIIVTLASRRVIGCTRTLYYWHQVRSINLLESYPDRIRSETKYFLPLPLYVYLKILTCYCGHNILCIYCWLACEYIKGIHGFNVSLCSIVCLPRSEVLTMMCSHIEYLITLRVN